MMEKVDAIDGLDFLMDMFFKDKVSMDRLFEYIYFFDKDLVKEHAAQILEDIADEEKSIPVRYSHKDGAYFKKNNVKRSSPNLKNKMAAKKTMESDAYYANINGRSEIRVCIDPDGNKTIKDYIFQKTKHSFERGKSTIVNSMISHIWGNTNDPLFFSLLWNIVITPLPLSFILDKNADITYQKINNLAHKEFIVEFQELIKAVSIILYNPNELMKQNLIDHSNGIHNPERIRKAKELIDNNKIKFLPYHSSHQTN
jgi:hypothetical protein